MTALGLKCFKEQCRQKPMYFCCSPEVPACIDCSDQTCNRCHKTRVTPLKSLNKKQGNIKIQRCRGCNKSFENNYISFPCEHLLCHRCMAHRICQYIRFKKWSKIDLENPKKSIKCHCQSEKYCQITDFLQNYCFCCGQPMTDNHVNLKYGLRIRNTCKNRIQLDVTFEDEQEKKCFLIKQQLEGLFLRCQMCMGVTEEKNNCKDCPGKPIQNQSKKEENLQSTTKIQILDNQKKKQPKKVIQQALSESQRSSEYQITSIQCFKCLKRQLPKYLLKIKGQQLCWNCYEESKRQIQAKIQKKLIKPSKCDICSKPIPEKHLSHQQNEPILCQRCLSENNRIWKKHKGVETGSTTRFQMQKIAEFQHKTNPPTISQSFKQTFKDSNYTYLSKQDKKEEVYKCISCQRQYIYCMTNTISSELGGYLCENCVFYSKSLGNNDNKHSSNRKKRDDSRKKLSYEQKPSKQSSFDKHLTMKKIASELQFRYSYRPILETIVKQIPDEVQLCIQSSRAISCFKCGYFGQEDDWNQSQIGKVCISCFIYRNNDKK